MVAPPTGTNERLGPYERPGTFNDRNDVLMKRIDRDRLGQDFVHASIARLGNAMHFGMAGQEDDRDVGISAVAGLAHQAGKVEPVERLHRPVGDDDVRAQIPYFPEGIRGVNAEADLLDPHGGQDRLENRVHVQVVVDNQDV